MTDYVKFFDTTLRDGEQSPGFSLSADHKVALAQQLTRLGVDVIEAGFPATSPDDFLAVQRIAREVRGPIIAGLARAVEADIDQCWAAIKDAPQPRIHTFLPSADIHLDARFSVRREEALERVKVMVARARSYTPDVEFSPMDTTGADWSYVCQVLEAAIGAGATTVNIADTSGFAQPDEFGMLITYIREHVPNIAQATISVHCHNDLGLAVANSLAAIKAGARQVECCVNGIGERAGNAALEELATALTVRRDHHRVSHGLTLQQLVPTSTMLQQFTGVLVQPNKAVVGQNAVSGRHALRTRLEELGLLLTQDELNQAHGVYDAIGHVYR